MAATDAAAATGRPQLVAFPHPLPIIRAASVFYAHGDAHAAADAQGGEALLGFALAHFMQQRGEHAGAGGADRMADGDGAAIHVHDIADSSPCPC